MSSGTAARTLLAGLALMLSGCAGQQSVLDPHSAEAWNLTALFWFFTAVCALVWLLVMAALAVVLLRRGNINGAQQADTPQQHRRKTAVVGGLVAVTATVLVVFTLASFYATRDLVYPPRPAVTIKVTGQQWWWQVEYQDPDPSRMISTANEIHIPVGRPVTFDLEAADVIHSFWVPNLMGKQDLIPGRRNSLTLQADRPGVYRGQCAEYCGLQHAHMAFLVVAESPARFETWRQSQLLPAAAPTQPLRARGLQVFLGSPCASCHAIAGAGAGGHLGPDLTHFGGQATLGAGLLRNTPANLAAWLADPQALKPGTNMPQVPLSAPDRAAVVAYLEGLR